MPCIVTRAHHIAAVLWTSSSIYHWSSIFQSVSVSVAMMACWKLIIAGGRICRTFELHMCDESLRIFAILLNKFKSQATQICTASWHLPPPSIQSTSYLLVPESPCVWWSRRVGKGTSGLWTHVDTYRRVFIPKPYCTATSCLTMRRTRGTIRGDSRLISANLSPHSINPGSPVGVDRASERQGFEFPRFNVDFENVLSTAYTLG